MNLTDQDLQSIQEVRHLLTGAQAAAHTLASYSGQQLDRIVRSVSDACKRHAVSLAKQAAQETGFGIWQDKVLKNLFASVSVYEAIKDIKTVGVLAEDNEKGLVDIGVPVGVIAGIVPSTNPTSTVIYKSLIALKAGNAIVFSPHPGARRSICETARIVAEAVEAAGGPSGAVSCISHPTLEATQELMRNDMTRLILATGGGAMVKAAYSSGTPAIGVGAGNGPAYIDHTADIPKAVRLIIDSKTFDNGTICASEQSIVVEEAVADEVEAEFTRQGACFLTEEDADRLSKFLLRPNGTMNPAVVGHSVEQITKLAGLANVPSGARLLVAREHRVGLEIPYSREKLCPVIAYYVEKNADTALTKVQDILHVEGVGHSFCIHSTDEQQMRRFALAVPASRIILNGMGALGGIGATTNLFPALTLGCGNVGGSSSSNNIGPLDLINIRRAARGTKQLDELCAQAASVSQEKTQKDGYGQHKTNDVDDHRACGTLTPQQIDHIVERILKEIM